MSKGSFGQHLRRERELRGVSRDEVCAATRIGPRFLDALENEQWELLPGGIFNRGFIRAIARFLGLDEDDLVAEYDLAITERQGDAPMPDVTPAPQPARMIQRPAAGRRAWIIGSPFVVLLLAVLLGWKWHGRVERSSAEAAARISTVPLAAQAQPNSPQSGTPTGPLSAGNIPASSPKTDILELKIEAGKETAVTISVDGNKVFDSNMIAGQSRSFSGRKEITISAQDGGALLLELNGHTLPPLGPPGQPGSATLTPSDLQSSSGGAN
jgi:cytoskeleton protein RodZ